MRNALLSVLLQPFGSLSLPPANAFAQKTAVITGGNTGLGLEVARHLVKLGASKVIITSRNADKGEAAKRSIEKTTGISAGTVEVWPLDMSRWASVKEFAQRVKALPVIDLLFLNAGLATLKYALDPEGWEKTLQCNVLSTALLGLLLLPKLVEVHKTRPQTFPHLIITTSGLHSLTPFEERKAGNILEKLNQKATFEGHSDPVEHYMTSKLLDIYITKELAKLVPFSATDVDGSKHAVIVNTVDPGLNRSELQREGAPFPLSIILPIFGRTPEVGSRTLVDAAYKGEESHGQYLESNTVIPKAGKYVYTDEGKAAQRKVWAEIVDVLAGVEPSVRSIADGNF